MKNKQSLSQWNHVVLWCLVALRNVSEEHEGTYHCEAQNEGEAVKSQPALLLPAGG